MFNNKLLDWVFDNGISTFMLVDEARIQHMDLLLSREAKNKNCLDIGFGTGILSFLAIKYGAQHVTAFEVNYERYLLGQYLIEKMGLQGQITLHNARFEAGLIPDNCELIFQGIVDQEFWADGLASCAVGHNLPILPSRYKCEYYLVELTQEQCQKFVTPKFTEPASQQGFGTSAVTNAVRREKGIDFYNQSFIATSGHLQKLDPNRSNFSTGVVFPGCDIYHTEIQTCLDDFWQKQESRKIHQISNVRGKILNNPEYTKLIASGIKISSYEFDYFSNTVTVEDIHGKNISALDRSKLYLDMDLPVEPFKDKISMLLTLNTIAHEELELVTTPIVLELMSDAYRAEKVDRRYGTTWDLPMNHTVFINPVPENQIQLHCRQYLDNGVTRFWFD